jgi:hypothetical protein
MSGRSEAFPVYYDSKIRSTLWLPSSHTWMYESGTRLDVVVGKLLPARLAFLPSFLPQRADRVYSVALGRRATAPDLGVSTSACLISSFSHARDEVVRYAMAGSYVGVRWKDYRHTIEIQIDLESDSKLGYNPTGTG